MEVRVSGAVMASIFLELANGQGDVEGFLLGDSTGRTINTISDSQTEHLRYERITTIQGILPCPKVFSFYNGIGQIDHEKLKAILQDKKESIIGWYKYRRNSQQLVTMRERYVHHNLIKGLGFEPSKEFLFALFTSSSSSALSTHLHNYQMLTANNVKSKFDSHKLRVVNLGDTSHTGYRLQPHTVRTSSTMFNDVINVYRGDFLDSNGCLQQALTTHSMCISLMTKMKGLMNEVKDSEQTVMAMDDEVTRLRAEVAERKQRLQTAQTATMNTSRQQPQATSSSKQESEQAGTHNNLIDLNTEREGVVEPLELITPSLFATTKCLQNPNLHKPGSTPTEIKNAVHGSLRVSCTVSECSDSSQEDIKQPLSGNRGGMEVLKPQVVNGPQEIDEDETQDFSLPIDGDVLMPMESMSPQY